MRCQSCSECCQIVSSSHRCLQIWLVEQMTDSTCAEVSLDNLHQLRRSQHSKIMALKSRITSLRAELVEKQDPGRMQETQRLISVRQYGMTPHPGKPVAKHNRSFTGPYRPSKRYPRESRGGRGHRDNHNQGHTTIGPRQTQHDNSYHRSETMGDAP